MLNNYHTHTYRCKHATGNIDDYVKEAIKLNGTTLGFSDHTPFPNNQWIQWRMNMNELYDYIKELDCAKEKYSHVIDIYKGLECEYDPKFFSYYNSLLNEYKFDYLALGLHFYKYENEWIHTDEVLMNKDKLDSYAKLLVEAMETGFFKFVAHPDFFATSYLNWDKNAENASIYIIENAMKLDIPLEINGNGFRKNKLITSTGKRYPYPLYEFWNTASKLGAKVIIGSDAHKPRDVYDFKKCLSLASSLKLNIIEKLSLS